MGQPQNGFQYLHKGATGAALLGVGIVVAIQDRFGQLQVPVAVLVPDKLVGGVAGHIKAEAVQGVTNFLLGTLQGRDDPAVGQ